MSLAPTAFSPRSPARAAAWLLACAGVLPFLAGAADAAFLGRDWLSLVQVYAAIIASFVCGIHWGAALVSPEGPAIRLFLASNVAALLAWLAAVLPHRAGFFLLAVLFGMLLLVDRDLWRRGLWPDWFWRLRLAISAVVVGACLFIGGAA